MADIVQFDLPNALAAHNQLQQQQDARNTQNALAQAVPLLQSDPQNAFATAAKGSPQAALQLLPFIKQADDEKKAKLADATDTLGKLAYSLKTQYKDPMIRKAVAQSQAAQLAAHNITPDQIANFDYSDQSLDGVISQSQSIKDQIAQSNADRTFEAGRSDHADTVANEKANRAVTIRGQNMTDARAAEGGANAWQILTDPKTNTQFRYKAKTGEATTLDGSAPYTPSGAQKIGGGQPRSAATAAVTKYMQENPNATAEDVTQFAANFSRTTKAVTAFATGKQGDTVRFLNNSVGHLNTLSGLADALGNGDIKQFNALAQQVAEQTGSAAPTNFDEAKQIIGNEIVKAITGSAAGVEDRQKAQAAFDRAKSPAQLKGAIKTAQDLMGRQLEGLKKQYKNTTGRDDFETMIEPDTAAALEPKASQAGAHEVWVRGPDGKLHKAQ